MELLRARRDKDNGLVAQEAEPPAAIDDIWASAAQLSTVGIFIVLFVACLYLGRALLLPVLAALVVGLTLAPIVNVARRYRISPAVSAIGLGVVLLAAVGAASTWLTGPVSGWIAKAPEIGAAIKQKLYVLDQPLSALRQLQETLLPSAGNTVALEPSHLGMLTPVLTFVTPAAAELLLFFVVLIFFLATQMDFRRYMVSFFPTRDAKLRFIRIANEIELSLASYLAVVTAINFAVGVLVAIGAWLFGFPNPLLFGALAMVLNYIPYLGPACMVVILFGVGLVSFPSLGYALIPPAALVALATLEGHAITPTVLGKRLTLNPLVVLLALAFWSWLWGPMGAFLAVPLTIIGQVTLQHLFPPDEDRLPG